MGYCVMALHIPDVLLGKKRLLSVIGKIVLLLGEIQRHGISGEKGCVVHGCVGLRVVEALPLLQAQV